jgi:hypothetical protein
MTEHHNERSQTYRICFSNCLRGRHLGSCSGREMRQGFFVLNAIAWALLLFLAWHFIA